MDAFYITLEHIASRVYSELGTSHSEFAYHRAMEAELRACGIFYETEKSVLINYTDSKGHIHNIGTERMDLFIKLDTYIFIVELKATTRPINCIDIFQVKKYMKALIKQNINAFNGAVINFPQPNTKRVKNCIEFVRINHNDKLSEYNIIEPTI